MRDPGAPAVVYPAGPSRWAGLALGLIGLGAAALTLAWSHLAGPGDTGPLWGLISLLISGLWVTWYWRTMPAGQLIWDGRSWLWRSRAYPVGTPVQAPIPLLDAQRLLVLRLRNRAGVGWVLWLQSDSDPAHWLALRRAVYAPAVPVAEADTA